MKTYYTVYKVTNKKNGKLYIGVHKTTNLDDGYMGSGKYLRHSINKHGMENFTKEILFVFDNPDDMYTKEAELVDIDFVAESNTYNLKVGGFGGFDYVNSTGKNLYGRNGKTPNIKSDLKRGRETQKFLRENDEHWSQGLSQNISNGVKEYWKVASGHFKGRHHSPKTKQLIGEKNRISQSGSGNSQYGTRWIYSLEEKKSKKIPKDVPTPDGWNDGRKINIRP